MAEPQGRKVILPNNGSESFLFVSRHKNDIGAGKHVKREKVVASGNDLA